MSGVLSIGPIKTVHANQRQITVIGLSLGALVASMAMGIDPRIKAGVFLVHGGNTGKMMQTNSVSRFGKKYRVPDKEYQENQKNYANYLMEVADKGFENVTPCTKDLPHRPVDLCADAERTSGIDDKRPMG